MKSASGQLYHCLKLTHLLETKPFYVYFLNKKLDSDINPLLQVLHRLQTGCYSTIKDWALGINNAISSIPITTNLEQRMVEEFLSFIKKKIDSLVDEDVDIQQKILSLINSISEKKNSSEVLETIPKDFDVNFRKKVSELDSTKKKKLILGLKVFEPSITDFEDVDLLPQSAVDFIEDFLVANHIQ